MTRASSAVVLASGALALLWLAGGFRRFSLGGRFANLARLVAGRAVMGPPGLKLISNFSRCLTPFPGIHETLAGHYMYHLSPRDVSSLFFIGRAALVANSKIKTKTMLKKKSVVNGPVY